MRCPTYVGRAWGERARAVGTLRGAQKKPVQRLWAIVGVGIPQARESVVVTKLMSEYRALGWEKQAPAVKRDQLTYQRRVAAWQMKVGVRANKLQEYFRPQVIF